MRETATPTRDAPLRRLALLGLVFVAVVLSCSKDVTGPGGGRFMRGFSWNPVFPAALRSVGVSSSGIVDFNRVHVVLHHTDGTIALDTTITFPASDDSLIVKLDVRLLADAPSSGEPMTVDLGYLDAAGDTVFKGGPISLVATVPSGGGTTAPVQVPVAYTGPGASAATVAITPHNPSVVAGGTFTLAAAAKDAGGTVLAGTPVVWTSLDTTIAKITAPAAGAGTTLNVRGTARIVAQLLTGPADTAQVLVTLPASQIMKPATASGDAQTSTAGAALAQPVVVKVAASDGVGVAGTTVTFAVASGGGSVSPLTAVSDANGLAQTTWTLGTGAGAQGITATAAPLTGSPLTYTATATAAAASKLVITSQPAGAAAGAAFAPIVVTAQDANGNVATSFTGNVALTIGTNPGAATLGGTVSIAAVAGVATFPNITLNKVGTGYTLIASSGSLTSATSNGFAVTAGSAATLAFTVPPASTTAGATLVPVVVTAQDANGNVATGFTGNVALAIGSNPGAATLGGTVTVAAVAGVATFSTLSINKVGTGYTLVASSGSLGSATSNGITISAGTAGTLAFTAQPASTSAGATFATITVAAQDANGNVVTTYTGAVTAALGVTTSGAVLSGTVTVNAVAGVASFTTLSVNKNFTGYTLVASAAGLTGATSSAFDIATGLATTFAVTGGTGQTGPGGVALPTPITVRATDAGGNGVAGKTVTFATTNGSVSPTSAVTDANGLAVTTWTLGATVGSQSMTATSAGLANSPLTITATGTPGAATHLVFSTPPSSAAAGAANTPAIVVQALDANSLIASGFSGNVALAIGANPGGSAIGGTLSVAAVAGVATFSNIVLNKVGTGYTLVATSSGLISSTSNPFAISAGAAANIAVVGGSGQTGTVSTLLPTALTVKVTDASANVVSGTSVTFAVTAGGGSLTTTTTTTDVNGLATTTWTLGTLVGAQTVAATSAGLAGSPATFSATGVVAGLRTWIGATSNQWTDGTNWAPAGAPASTDSVVVSSNATLPVLSTAATVKALTLATGGVLSMNGGALTVTSSLDATGSIVVAGATGSVTLTSATGATVKGVVSNPVTIQGVYTASGSFSASSLVIANGGSLDLNGQPVIVTSGGSFSTTGTGTITMTNISSDLTVSGAATFSGGDETGKLTAGTIGVGGNFSQGGSTLAAFNAGVGSALNLVLSGNVATTLSIADPANSIMPNVAISNPAGVTATTGFITKDLLLTTGTLSGTLGATINGTFTDQFGHWAAGNISFATSSSPISALTTSITAASQITFNNNPSILAGPLTVNGAVNALGNLVINGNTLTVNGDLSTSGSGQLTMNNSSDIANVTGNVSFGSTTTGGPMIAGTLNIGGNLSQTGSPQSISTSGTNTIVFNGAGTQTVIFSSPDGNFAGGVCSGTACVQNLTVNKPSGQLNFLTTTKVQGNFTNTSATPVQTPLSNGAFIVVGNAAFGQNGTFHHVGVGGSTFSNGGATIDSVTYFGAGQAYNPATLGEQLYSDIRGTANWTAPGTLPGLMVVDGSGQLNVATSGAVVSGSFTTSGTGTLRMTTNTTDSLVIGNNATFGGGATTGLLTTGNIVIGGPTVTMTGLAFDASGVQTTTFNATTGTQSLIWNAAVAGKGYNNITLRGGAQRQFGGNQTILGNMLIDPTSGNVNGSVVLTFAGNITDQTATQSAWNGSSLAIMTGTPTVLPTHFGVNTLTFSGGTVTLNDSLITGFMVVDGASAHLKLNGHRVKLSANFTTQNGGVVEMTNVKDTLDIGGSATFNGGSTSGLLTHGFINVQSFTQGGNAAAFAADSTLRTSIGRGNGTQITFANPGFGTLLSHFGEMMIGDGSTHTLNSDVYVQGKLTTPGGSQFPVTSANHLITAQGANASKLFLTNTRLLLVDGSPVTKMDTLEFLSMDPTLPQLEVQRSGTTGTGDFAATINAPIFSTLPTSGSYIKATDTNGSSPFLTINVSLPNPAGSTNAAFLPVFSGAIVNGWPLIATATAIKSGFWSDNTVWSTNVVPTIADNVVIPSSFAVTVGANANAHNLTVNSNMSGGLTLSGGFTLSVSGAPVNNGTTTCSADNVIVGSNTSLSGTWCGMRVTGTVTLAGPTTVSGQLTIPAGALIVGGNTLNIGFLQTQGTGVLEMTGANGIVNVNGSAAFGGGAETGFLTAGTLNILGNFAAGTGTMFDASGNHLTQFSGSAVQTIGWAAPAANVGFNNVQFNHSWGRVFTSDVYIGGAVQIFSSDTGGVISGAHRVTLGGTNTGVLDQSFGGGWQVGTTNFAMPAAQLTFLPNLSNVDTTIFSGGGTFALPFTQTTRNVVVDNTNLNLNGHTLTTQGNSFTTQNGGTLQMSSFVSDSLDAGFVYFNGGSTSGALLSGGMAVSGIYQGYDANFNPVTGANPASFSPTGLRTWLTGATPTVAFRNPGSGGTGSHFWWVQTKASTGVVLKSDIAIDSLLPGDAGNDVWSSDAPNTTVRTITTKGINNSGTFGMTMNGVSVVLNDGPALSLLFNNVTWTGFPSSYGGALILLNRSSIVGPTIGLNNYSAVNFGTGNFVQNVGLLGLTLGTGNTPTTCNLFVLAASGGVCR